MKTEHPNIHPLLESPIWATPLEGINLPNGSSLENLAAQHPQVLVFLRHFGCIFCRELVADFRAVTESQTGYPPVVFVYQGSVADGERFFGRLWPEARAIADLPRRLYTAFGLEKGSVGQMFGPQVFACGLRAALKGHGIGLPIGDPWMMPGIFGIHRNRVLFSYDFSHAGDHPRLDSLPELIRRVSPEPVST